MKHVAAFSSNTQEWYTPREFLAALAEEFGPFTLDPCATPESTAADRFFTKDDDGLAQSWANETVFLNPPYGYGIGKWIQKAYEEFALHGATVVALIPAKTETRWWHDYVMLADEIRFIKGRMRFSGSAINAPFPSCVVVWNSWSDLPPTFSAIGRDGKAIAA